MIISTCCGAWTCPGAHGRITSHPFRLLAREQDVRWSYRMISARALVYGANQEHLLFSMRSALCVSALWFGTVADGRGRSQAGSPGTGSIDLNLGCPTRKIVRNGDGGALMRDQSDAAPYLSRGSRGPLPVTVKMRKGWSEAARPPWKSPCRLKPPGSRL